MLCSLNCSYIKHAPNTIRRFLKGYLPSCRIMHKPNELHIGDVISPHTHKHTHFTAQRRDDSRQESASSAPCPEPEALQGVSTPLQSATDSPSLEGAPATTATPAATPATPSSLALSEAAQGDAGSTDDVFSTAEVFSAPDSPHKEFHSAVVRALSKEPSVKADQAPGTPDEAESRL